MRQQVLYQNQTYSLIQFYISILDSPVLYWVPLRRIIKT